MSTEPTPSEPQNQQQPVGPAAYPPQPSAGAGAVPPSPGGYSPQQYQYPAHAQAYQPEAPNAVLIFVLGLLGIGPVAWYLGNKSREQIKAAPPGTYKNEVFVTIGWVLGIIQTVLWLIMLGAFAIFFIVLVIAAAAS